MPCLLLTDLSTVGLFVNLCKQRLCVITTSFEGSLERLSVFYSPPQFRHC
jgi:hypothetical protein